MPTRPPPCMALAAAVAVAALAGCATHPRRPVPPLDAVISPVLILPPIVRKPAHQPAADRLGAQLFQEVARMTRGNVVAAWNVPELGAAAQVRNLAARGAVNVQEAAAMGAVAGCRSVVVTDVIDVHPFTPQRLQITGYLVDVADQVPLRRRAFPIDSRDPAVRDEYARFMSVGQRRSGDPLERTDQSHLAGLSPRSFERYAAYVVVRGLIAP